MHTQFKSLLLFLYSLLVLIMLSQSASAIEASAPPGEYASIEVKPALAIIQSLKSDTPQDDLIAEITHRPGNYIPIVLWALADKLYRQGDVDNAIFWLHAGRLRVQLDADLCTDISAQAALPALDVQMSQDFAKKQLEDMPKLRAIIERVIIWDETTPYNYDRRWVSLHGMSSLMSHFGVPPPDSLTVPKEQWDTLAQKNRARYQQGLDALNVK